jgi:hypothetical protein
MTACTREVQRHSQRLAEFSERGAKAGHIVRPLSRKSGQLAEAKVDAYFVDRTFAGVEPRLADAIQYFVTRSSGADEAGNAFPFLKGIQQFVTTCGSTAVHPKPPAGPRDTPRRLRDRPCFGSISRPRLGVAEEIHQIKESYERPPSG